MKKIAIVSPGFAPVPAVNGGGVEQLITTIIEKNEINDSKIIFDTYTIYNKKLENIKYKKTNIILVKTNSFIKKFEYIFNRILKKINIKMFISSYDKKVAKIIKNKKYEYIIIENSMYLFKKIYKKYRNKTKFIFHLHNDIDEYYKPPVLCKYIGNRAYKILTVSDYIKKRFESFSPNSSKKIEILYNCIDIQKFSKINIKPHELKKKYNINKNDLIYLYVGRYDEEKGLLELVKAFRKIKYKNIKLLIVGKISDSINKYQSEVINEVMEDSRIIPCGYVDRESISSYFNISNVIVIPSICEEAFGLVAIEAMAMSKPLIVTNSGGLIEVVEPSFSKIINKNSFEPSMISAIKYYYNNVSILKKIGALGAKHLKNNEDFHEDNYYENLLKKIK